MSKANRNFKSSLFTHLFSEPDKGYELYNAIAPGRFPPDTPVKDVTLSDVLYMDRINDLSFLVGDKLVVFFEHQGSINENMPLRDLIYCGRVYEMVILNSSMYSKNRITIPTPEFYVLYNGESSFPEKATYRLSDSYASPVEGEPALELIVNVINVNKGLNNDIMSRSETLYGYATLVSKVREYEKSGMIRADAIQAAITDCIKLGILAEYLGRYASEVFNMLLQEWNWEDARAVWAQENHEKGFVQGIEQGKEQGIEQGIVLGIEKGLLIAREKYEPMLAEMVAEIAELKAQIGKEQ